MKALKIIGICLIFVFMIQSFVVALPVSATDSKSTVIGQPLSISPLLLQKYKNSFKSPDTQPIYGYAKSQDNSQYLAYDQAQIALDYLSLAQEAQNSGLNSLKDQYIAEAMGTLKFMTSYLVNSRVRDKNGIIEFWDTSLQDQALTRVSKIARDQALALVAMDKLLTFIDNGYSVENSTYVFYKESFANTWKFLSSLYDSTNGGWYTKTTPINESTFSIDTTKRTADNMIIISSLAQITHISLLAPGFTKTNLENILTKSMDFFVSKFLVSEAGIASYGNADGSSVTNQMFFAKENALYGLANLALYKLTGNSTYASNAEYIWSYIKNAFWEMSFGGVLGAISAQGDPMVLSKTLEDQVFFAELSLELASLKPNDPNYLAYYLKMYVLIKHNFIQNYNVASSTDYRFNPSSEYYVRSTAYYIDFLITSPHISAISMPDSIIVGSKLPTKIYISNNANTILNVSIKSSNSFTPVSFLANKSVVEQDLTFENSVSSGSQKLQFNLTISKTLIQQVSIETKLNPNVRIPNGLIYLVGAGILAGLVVLVRRPPEFIKKYIQELREQQSSNETEQQNITEEGQ